MLLRFRRLLPWLIGALWLFASWQFLLGAPLVDRMYVAVVRHFRGVDAMSVLWSRLINEAGQPFCAKCGSVFFMPPSDLSPDGQVHCGDCGHAITTLAELRRVGRGDR